MARSSVKVKDNGANALLKRMKAAQGSKAVTVGIHAEEGSAPHGEATLLDVASFHEFGTDRAPRRSFIADWADESEKQNHERLSKIGAAILTGALPSLDVGLERFGLVAVGEVQRRIVAGIDPPLADATIERKGSSTPLVDTGQLKSAVTYRVEK